MKETKNQNFSCVYVITNRTNGRRYVGSAVNFQRRQWSHLGALRKGISHCPHLQAAWTKHGESAFEWSVLELVPNWFDLIPREQFWIDHFRTFDRSLGYNARPKAGSQLGLKHSEETKLKLREAKLGKPINFTPEGRLRVIAFRREVFRSPQWCQRISDGQVGRVVTEVTRKKLSEVNTGRRHTPEAIEKIRQANLARPRKPPKEKVVTPPYKMTEDHKAKISQTLTGRPLSPEHIAKASASRIASGKGKEAARLMWARRTPEERALIASKRSATLKAKQSDWTPEMIAANEERKRKMERDRTRAKRKADREAAQALKLAAE